MANPREIAERVEQEVTLPPGDQERFSGFGVMGLPFRSGHILGLRNFPTSSLGVGYRSVWHRNPEGEWSLYQTVPPQFACPRYFGSEIASAIQVSEIKIVWSGTHVFNVSIEDGRRLNWEVVLSATPVTSFMNYTASIIPASLWLKPQFLGFLGQMAGAMLRAGRLGLAGTSPNGQRFMAAPAQIWMVRRSSATIDGQDAGSTGPLQHQVRLGDFWIPQRGIFVFGSALFDAYNPALHVLRTSKREFV